MAKEQLKQWYDEDYFDQYPKHNRRIRQILRNITFKPSDVVCEFGCGLGHILMAISSQIRHGTGIDVSEYATSRATTSAQNAGLTNIDFKSIDIKSLGSIDEYKKQFDKVLMMDISEHLYDDTLLEFLQSARSVLKPDGRLLLHTPNANYYLERMKARNFIVKQFESHIAVRNYRQHIPILEKAGFSNIEVLYLPHYNRVLGIMDKVLMNLPFIKRYFQARILITAKPL